MKSVKKAPAYEQAKAVLDSHIAKTGEVLSIRKLKAACGGGGSNETYHQYRARWRSERGQSSGVIASLLALKSQIDASAALANSLLDQALLQLALSGLNSSETEVDDIGDDDEDPEDHTEEVADADRPRNDVRPVLVVRDAAPPSHDIEDPGLLIAAFAIDDEDTDWPTIDGTRSADKIEALANTFAEHSEARFLEGNHTSLSRDGEGGPQTAQPHVSNQPGQGESDKSHGESPASRSAPVPTVQEPATQAATSLSRSNGGAQQGALPLEPKKPAQGESDPTGGSTNGAA